MLTAREQFAKGRNVSRETLALFDIYAELLSRWQRTINLVSATTLEDVWNRHFHDSAQVLDIYPSATRWMDLGTGAGFPGLVLALLLRNRPSAQVYLVEIDQRKCAFLREVVRKTNAPAKVLDVKIDVAISQVDVDVLTSRAVANLDQLIEWARPQLEAGACAVFLKGKSATTEYQNVHNTNQFNIALRPSQTNADSRLIVIEPKLCPPRTMSHFRE